MYISRKITEKLIEKGIIAERKYSADVYEYGIELILGDLLNYILIFVTGIVLKQDAYIPLLYLICFVSVRIFSGGFHAATHAGCSIFMIVFYLIFTLMYRVTLHMGVLWVTVFIVLSYLPIVLFAPVRNKNRYVREKKARINRIRAICLYSAWAAVSVFMILNHMLIGYVISAVLYTIVLNIIFAESMKFLVERMDVI